MMKWKVINEILICFIKQKGQENNCQHILEVFFGLFSPSHQTNNKTFFFSCCLVVCSGGTKQSYQSFIEKKKQKEGRKNRKKIWTKIRICSCHSHLRDTVSVQGTTLSIWSGEPVAKRSINTDPLGKKKKARNVWLVRLGVNIRLPWRFKAAIEREAALPCKCERCQSGALSSVWGEVAAETPGWDTLKKSGGSL